MCKHYAWNLINMTKHNRASIEMLGRSYVCVFLFLTLCFLSYLQD